MTNLTHDELASRLCPSCGMCCNGVLFSDLKLQPGDDPEPLRSQGIELRGRGKSLSLPQPCPAFQGGLCRIYSDRPSRCRSFECQLLQRVGQNKILFARAERIIQTVRIQVEDLKTILRQLGNHDEAVPLQRRCQTVMAQPLDLSGPSASIRLRRKLLLGFNKLARSLQRDFLA